MHNAIQRRSVRDEKAEAEAQFVMHLGPLESERRVDWSVVEAVGALPLAWRVEVAVRWRPWQNTMSFRAMIHFPFVLLSVSSIGGVSVILCLAARRPSG
jgi:hypothetical protein